MPFFIVTAVKTSNLIVVSSYELLQGIKCYQFLERETENYSETPIQSSAKET
jgi:hypothetical protein